MVRPVLLILPVRLEIVLVLRSQDPQTPFSQSFASKLAIHRRYTERRFLCIPYCYLQGITVRSVRCNYNVIQQSDAAPFGEGLFMFWLLIKGAPQLGRTPWAHPPSHGGPAS